MKTFTHAERTDRPRNHCSWRPIQDGSQGHLEAGPAGPSAWNETELDDAIAAVCNETPAAPMLACWRALDYCRRSIPHGTPESLRAAMRTKLRDDMRAPASTVMAAG